MWRSSSVSVLSAPEASPPHLAWIAERLRQVTVEIHSEAGGGAGILWAADLVVTNAHVARDSWARVGLAADRPVDARLVIADRRAGLALLRMPRSGAAPAGLARSDAVRGGAPGSAPRHPPRLRRP